MKDMRILFASFLFLLFSFSIAAQVPVQIHGWNILSDSREDNLITLKAARSYQINHLQLSHDLVMDLKELKDTARQHLVNDLVSVGHRTGIKEVVAWDHALYSLSYYPDKFKTGTGGTIDLDNPDFWTWFREDYRQLMGLVPEIDGIVLTFIETGARIEKQHSAKLLTGAEKLAAVVDAVADVVCEELGKNLYIRTFAYTDAEYENTIGCISHIKSDKVILMMKETPHDFFLTHPNDKYAGTIDRPTLIEFDACNEFNGQGVIANTYPEYILRRWSELMKRPNVIGYVARTDRYRNTRLVGTPNEILLYALMRYTEIPDINAETIYDEFITLKYGRAAVPFLKPAFSKAYGIVSSSFYTLGTNVSNHSKMDFDPYKSSYGRHVSGKWLDPPLVHIDHGVNRTFHYWSDIIEHIAPARYKSPDEALKTEAPQVLANGWVTPEEKMDEEWLRYIMTEKAYGVKLAEEALNQVKEAKDVMDNASYDQVYQLFTRTLITARMYEAAATAYFGYRVYARGEAYRSDWLQESMSKALDDLLSIAREIDEYSQVVPRGQWNWRGDAATARKYHQLITETGWKEYGNVIFKPKVRIPEVDTRSAIDKYRKGELIVRVKPGERVTIEQVKHDFWFGCAVSSGMFDGSVSQEAANIYREKFLENFNSAVTENALKWPSMERVKGKVDYSTVEAMLKWTEMHGIPLRGHNLFWGIEQFIQPWVKEMGNKELKKTIRDRAQTITARFKGRLAEYDLNNEMIHGNYYEERLGPEITERMAVWALKGDKNAKLWLNDYDILTGKKLPEYLAQIRSFLQCGVPIAGIGVQGHLHAETFDRVQLKAALDSLAQFNLPIRITEFNIPGQRSKYYKDRNIQMTQEEEDTNASELVEYYKICFAHPAVEGILMWGFWPGANWIPVSSIYRRDWTLTPAGRAYKNLIFKEWWSKESGIASADGSYSTNVFYGKYKITVGETTKEIDFPKSSVKKVVDFTK